MKVEAARNIFVAMMLVASVAADVAWGQGAPSQIGQWSNVQTWPVEAIHTFLLPTGKVLFWQSWRESVGIWNPANNQFETAGLPTGGANPHNVFCSGHAWLDDGRLLVVGGHIDNGNGDNRADIYNPFTNTWANVDPNVPNVPTMGPLSSNPAATGKRWYPSATTLPNGDVLVLSGDVLSYGDTNLNSQIYHRATNSWETVTGGIRPLNDRLPEYPRVFVAPDGRAISLSDYANDTEYLDLAGGTGWKRLSDTLDPSLYSYGPAVMYEPGKIAYIGGGESSPTKHISLLDLNAATPTWSYAAEDMAQGRRQNNATILADGTILITGGSSKPGFNDQTGFIPQAELWNPQTQDVTPMASASSIYRGYHSTALLLPDGRVLVTGGNHDDATGYVEQKNAEIYSPPYLFKGARPTVTAAPSVVELGDTIYVQTPNAADITKALWVVPGAVTHAQNWTQRSNTLDFMVTDGGINIDLPASGVDAPPGYYMLFLVNSNGVPSIANWVKATLLSPNADNADFNGDLTVDGADLLVWQTNFGGPAGKTLAQGDANDDGIVDADDLAIWKTQFGMAGQSPASGGVPEPRGAVLALSALAAAARRRR